MSKQGLFQVIDSFTIKRRKEFYLIGELKEGNVKENWFIHVPLNNTLSLTIRIKLIEDIEFANEPSKNYKLLIIDGKESEDINNLLALNIGTELMNITIEGHD